jgi:aspartyl-tRNA(Asn)/glutamyl-tRNA(Gln) amidotransferase subunit A
VLRSFITVFEEQAMQVARAAELLSGAGHELGPLQGIPIALKDNVAVRGTRTTAGSKVLADWLPEADATVATRLRQAGAVFIGKTNMHEFAWGGTSANPHYGAVRNPWDPTRFPAGSSGGSAVAVAARLLLRRHRHGHGRLDPAALGRQRHRGPAPDVRPREQPRRGAARVEHGHGRPDDAHGGRLRAHVRRHRRLRREGRRQRAARHRRLPEGPGRRLQAPAHRRGARLLLRAPAGARARRGRRRRWPPSWSMGAQLVEVDIRNIHGNISAQLTIESAEPSTYHQRNLRERPQDYGDDVRTLLEAGELLLATQYLQAQRYRALLRGEFLEAFRHVDVFVCPSLPFAATRLGETTVEIVPGQPEDMLSAIMQFTGVASLTGLPSLNVPCGFDPDGLPIGMQLIGRPFAEATLLRAGHAFQLATGFHLSAPSL